MYDRISAASRPRHEYVGTEYRLLGLAKEGHGVATQAFVRAEEMRTLRPAERMRTDGVIDEGNPYASPPGPQEPADSGTLDTRNRGFWLRFTVILLLVCGLNVLRLMNTWRGWRYDGFEQIGWPWVFFERGGFSYGEYFYPHWLAADLGVAAGLACLGASATRHGVMRLVAKARTWGTPHAD
ncbi:MAG: hypothetical protein WD872_10250 [Pirellulaceae bacterium]